MKDPTRASFVLLITDGKETCMTDPEVTQRVQLLLKAKIRTYVVGFGSAVDPKQLTDMALAGGVAKDGKTYYQANSAAELEAALKVIAGSAIGDPDNPGGSCSGLPCPDGKCDPGFVCASSVCIKQQPDAGTSADVMRPGGDSAIAAAANGGCSCDVPGRPDRPSAASLLALLVLASRLHRGARLLRRER
jgi:hypothetical protein